MNILYVYYKVNIVRVENNKLSLFYFYFYFLLSFIVDQR